MPDTPVVHNISLPASGTPTTPTVDTSDKLTWTNNTGSSIASFTLPSCVGGSSPAPIANGATTRQFTVNANATKGDYGYSFGDSDLDLGRRNGTIDVN